MRLNNKANTPCIRMLEPRIEDHGGDAKKVVMLGPGGLENLGPESFPAPEKCIDAVLFLPIETHTPF